VLATFFEDGLPGLDGQALRRSRGNVLLPTFFGHRLPGLGSLKQGRRIDVDDDLVALGGSAGVETLVKGDLGEEGKGVGLLLVHGGGLDGFVQEPHGGRSGNPAPLVEGLPRGLQGLDEERAHLGLEPGPEHDHPVVPMDDVERPAAMPVAGLLGLDVLIDAPPAAHDALDVLGGPGAADPV
jgi:hypothetical protein